MSWNLWKIISLIQKRLEQRLCLDLVTIQLPLMYSRTHFIRLKDSFVRIRFMVELIGSSHLDRKLTWFSRQCLKPWKMSRPLLSTSFDQPSLESHISSKINSYYMQFFEITPREPCVQVCLNLYRLSRFFGILKMTLNLKSLLITRISALTFLPLIHSRGKDWNFRDNCTGLYSADQHYSLLQFWRIMSSN